MPALDFAQARELLLRVVNQFYRERNSPLPGAFVKAQMLVEAQNGGDTFMSGISTFVVSSISSGRFPRSRYRDDLGVTFCSHP